eukprot:10570209-Alexandrium_andersonii.AAC.1
MPIGNRHGRFNFQETAKSPRPNSERTSNDEKHGRHRQKLQNKPLQRAVLSALGAALVFRFHRGQGLAKDMPPASPAH